MSDRDARISTPAQVSQSSNPAGDRTGSEWFWSHYQRAAGEIVEFLGGDAIELERKVVGDVGCGDGIIDLGLVELGSPAQVIGFDILPTNSELLLDLARRENVVNQLPNNLEFRTSQITRLPAEDDEFDVLVSWSTFEHVAEPIPLLRDMRRVLKDDGVMMIQVWPFFHSEHGAHLWEWIEEQFVQLLWDEQEIERAVRDAPGGEAAKRPALDDYQTTNRITLDGLQTALLAADFGVRKVELLSNAFHVPPRLAHVPLSLLGIGGVKLLAS
jgi:SAM-dependent methyltransferase